MRTLPSGCWLLLAVALIAPRSATGQSAQDPLGGEAQDSVLGYEREVFEYPGGARRNPFRPLTAFTATGPRFEDLELTGIVYSSEVESVAVVADRATERRYRLREGQRIGTARVLEIRSDEVVFAITTFGVGRQAILRVKKKREQGE